ncbi:MAG: hypothetical protein ACXV2C_08975 [Candidatus Bathyarchaeia archaeon]
MAATPSHTPIFLREIYHREEPHTAENILDHLDTCVTELKKLDVTVRALITDNEEKMKKVRIAFYNKYNTGERVMFCPGDPPHALQLVINDILDFPQFKLTVKQAQSIGKKIKNTRYY